VIFHFLAHRFQVLVTIQGWMVVAATLVLVWMYFSMRSDR
jgi:hypothetical protein